MGRTINRYYHAVRGLLRIPAFILLIIYALLGVSYGLSVSGITPQEFIKHDFRSLVIIAAIIAAWYIHGTGLNDYADYEIDQINLSTDKSRPIIAGYASRNELLVISTVFGLIAAWFAARMGTPSLAVVWSLLVLNWAYSLKPFQISRRGGLAPALLPLGYVVLPVSLGYFVTHSDGAGGVISLIAGIYALFITRILLKDYRDVVGDKRHGKRTPLIRYGSENITKVARYSLAIGLIIIVGFHKQDLRWAVFPLAAMAGYSWVLLQQLAVARKWLTQRYIITAIGRLGTGMLLSCMLALLSIAAHAPTSKHILLQIVSAAIILISVNDIMRSAPSAVHKMSPSK